MAKKPLVQINEEYEKLYGFKMPERYVFKAKQGLTKEIVAEISWMKGEPEWMTKFRLRALEYFLKKPLPAWANLELLSKIQFDAIYYYLKPTEKKAESWEDVPEEIKKTFDRLGIPEAERKFLAGVSAQYESESVYHSMREDLQRQGVIFLDMDTGLKEHEDIVKEYFGTVIPPADNKFAALNSAVWSGGSFIYVPKGVSVELPLQAYFRINAEKMGQFERTLIITDEGSSVHYIEGCVVGETSIATNPGYKPVETIKVGDRVLTHTGRYQRVRHTQVRPYSGPLFSIWTWGDSIAPLEITEEHPMLAVRRSGRNKPTKWNVRWVTPADLRQGDYLVIPRRRVTRSRQFGDFSISLSVNDKKSLYKEFVEHVPSTPEFFRLAGYFLSEGSILNNFYLSFSFGAHELKYIEDVKALLKRVFGVTKIHELHHKRNHGISLTVSSARLARIFAHFGTSSATKRIPDWMLLEGPTKQSQLIVGFFRGDGNYINTRYPNGQQYEKFRLCTTSKLLAYQLRDVLLRLGIVATINARDRRAENRQTMYTVAVGGAFLKPFGILAGVPTSDGTNGHKRATRFFINDRYVYAPIRRITSRQVKSIPVYNFSVERDESYVAGGVAVHNCTAPVYASDSLHSAVVELIAKPHAKLRYTTIQNWSKNVYNLVTKRGVAYEDARIEWLDGNLGCVCEGELVYTEHGPVPIETVQPGTKVWSFNESVRQWVLRPVVARKDSGDQQVYEVVCSNGRTVRLTANHPLLSIHHDRSRPKKLGRYSLRWTPLEELSTGDWVVYPTSLPVRGVTHRFTQPALNGYFIGRNQYGANYEVASHARLPINLPQEPDEDVCWMLGLWLADGDFTITNGVNGGPRFGRVGWSVPRRDRARKRLVRVLNRYTGRGRLEERKDGHYFRINSLEFALWLQANSLCSGARQKRVPAWVFTLPTTMQLSFLAGYLDGDGHGHSSGLVVKSASRELLSDIQALATQCGVHAGAVQTTQTLLEVKNTGQLKSYTGHRLALSRVGTLRQFLSPRLRSRVKLAKRLYAYQQLTGLRTTRLLPETVGATRITSIRHLRIARTYDLQVDGTCSFVVNGLLVHNSKLTMKFPGVYMMGRGARGEVLSVAFAGSGQHQDAGAKMIHAAPDTHSVITSKSISKGGGRTSYRGLVKVHKGAENSKSTVRCDALLMDEASRSDTYPTMEIDEQKVSIGHEASVSKIGEEQLFYAMSRGLSEQEAMTMIVNGFIEPFVKELPLEYSVELNRLVQLEMEGAVG